MAIETYFKNIADAIREKAGTSGTLTPSQMPQAIADISGGASFEIPFRENLQYGYVVSDGRFDYTSYDGNLSDVYKLEKTHRYIFFTGSIVSDMLRVGLYYQDPINTINTHRAIYGSLIFDAQDSVSAYMLCPTIILPSSYYPNQSDFFLTITKTRNKTSSAITRVIDITNMEAS